MMNVGRVGRATALFFTLVVAAPVACTKGDGSEKGGAADKGGETAKGEGRRGGKGGKGRGDSGPTAVRVSKAEFKTLPRPVTVITVLTGRKQADVFPKVSGRISSIGPKEGDPVKAGEVLFRVDRADPGETFLTTPVVSPISGWVGRWMVNAIGEQVTPQAPVVTVVDDAALRATVFLPTADWLVVGSDTKARVAIEDTTRQGRVVSVARAAEAASSRGSVLVEVDNADHAWRAGMVARVTLELAPKSRMIIPSQALTITDQGAYVFVADSGVAKRVPIEFSVVDNDTVEVTKGLADASLVIVAGANMLSNDAPVKVLEEKAAL